MRLLQDLALPFRRYLLPWLLLAVAILNNVAFCSTCRIQNPDIPRAGRVGAAHGGGAGRGGRGRVGRQAGFFIQETTAPLALWGLDNNCPGRFLRSMQNGNPMQTGRGTKPVLNRRDEKRFSFLAADLWTDAFMFL